MEAAGDGIVFRAGWRLDDPEIIRDVRGLWAQAGLLPALAEGREKEICAAAYCGDQIVAVSTASINFSSVLRHKFFEYRCMVHSEFRQRDLAWRISAFSFKLLEDWSARHPDERILGLMIYVETDKFEAGLRKPVREKFGFTMHFMGYSPRGQQVRVVWFDHATLSDDGAARPGQANSLSRPAI